MFLKIWQNSQENTCAKVSFLIKLQAEAWNYLKGVSGTDIFLWICQTFKNTFFIEHLRWLLLYCNRSITKPNCLIFLVVKQFEQPFCKTFFLNILLGWAWQLIYIMLFTFAEEIPKLPRPSFTYISSKSFQFQDRHEIISLWVFMYITFPILVSRSLQTSFLLWRKAHCAFNWWSRGC